MPVEARLLLAFGGAAAITFAVTPIVIRLAWATAFLDHPKGYKRHGNATPYLGGLAVMVGFVPLAMVMSGADRRYAVIGAGAAVLWIAGTIDDRRLLSPWLRVALEVAAAAALYSVGGGWHVFGLGAADLVLSAAWIVGLVNAFNLFDNLDGAASTMGTVIAAGIGGMSALRGDIALASMAFALSGACAGFLPRNLANPARVFLGDGGSMPLGFVVAACAMALPLGGRGGWPAFLVALPLIGLPILDTMLVVFSRVRRHISVLTGGRDHLTHRVLQRLQNPRGVARALGSTQAALCLVAIGASFTGRLGEIGVVILYAAAVVLSIGLLEGLVWWPSRSQTQT